MFRRGPIRRAARLLSPRPLAALEDRPRQMLLQANLHMERGEYHRAAELYENLARGAEARGLLQRAPHLYLQSSRALILAGKIPPGIELLRHALKLLANAQGWQAAYRQARLAVDELTSLGYPEQARQIQAWLDQALQSHPEAASAPANTTAARPRLPAKCPFCGASLRPDEVQWLDDLTAECPYCGSSVTEAT